MKHFTLVFFFCMMITECAGQNLKVQSFDFSSTTRDTMISFPSDPSISYERILMHYGMRCKNAAISTGAERNKGCGEWDYSCNTYIVDSTRVDSLKQIQSEYIISGYEGRDGDVFGYSETPTYSYIQRTEKDVTRLGGSSDIKEVVTNAMPLEIPFGQAAKQLSYTYILHADQLTTKGLTAGPITGISFPVTQATSYDALKIRMKAVSISALDEGLDDSGWREVYYSSPDLTPSDNNLLFYQSLDWNGTSNIAVRLSYKNVDGGLASISGETTDYLASEYTSDSYDGYTQFGHSAHLNVQSGLEAIDKQITISYWQYGADDLPINSTILEAVDTESNRQLNIHHPWSNSNIFWDCGNDGTGYDRIEKLALDFNYKGQWNYWAFTKNADEGTMKIYLNGELWHEGEGKFKAINATEMNIGAGVNNLASRSYTKMSEFRIWNSELSAESIKQLMWTRETPASDTYDNLVIYYPLDTPVGGLMEDQSGNGNHAAVVGPINNISWQAGESPMTVTRGNYLIEQTLDQGSYNIDVSESIVRDPIPNQANVVTHYYIEGNDLVVEDWTKVYYPAGNFPVYDEDGNFIETAVSGQDGSFTIKDLPYYSKHPMAYEIMSFVTPYGIGLDFGEEGESWTFDVTDFAPILTGDKRMYMSRGGQWQEEMDIWFEYIEGTPTRDVLDIQQVWPVRAVDFSSIVNDFRFEPRLLPNKPEVDEYLLKTTITGHRQGGEFISRQHTMEMDVFRDTWRITQECADNPVYPQGGTWIFDREGWCPGAASYTRDYVLTDFIKYLDSLAYLDYSINNPPDPSNYIVNAQLVSYGAPNKSLDLEVMDILNPSQKIEYRKENPNCQAPKILLRNNGQEAVTKVQIKYGVLGRNEYWHTVDVNVAPLRTRELELPFMSEAYAPDEGDMFFATIVNVNNKKDDYPNNDSYTSQLTEVDHYDSEIIVELRTNKFGYETSYKIIDQDGNNIVSRSGFANNTFYRDTITGLSGCYTLRVEDSDDDGLSFWFPTDPAQNDGDGFFRIRNIAGANYTIDPDFGKFSEYSFTAGMVSTTEEIEELPSSFVLYPNPSSGKVYFDGLDDWNETINVNVMDQYGKMLASNKVHRYDLYGGLSALNNLVDGIYYVELMDGEKRAVEKLVKL